MRIRLSFALNCGATLMEHLVARCPLDVRVGETDARIVAATDQSPPGMAITLECSIAAPNAITVEPASAPFFTKTGRGRKRLPVAVCPEVDLLELRAQEIAGALSLLHGGIPIGVGLIFGTDEADHKLITESAEDVTLFEHLGRPSVLPPIIGPSRNSAIGAFDFNGELIGRLAERPGLLVYWGSCFTQAPVARYRELWRTLEQAFQLQSKALREAILSFPPAVELGFDDAELSDLEALRGRASHAADRLGHREAARVHRMVVLRIGRLTALVERVLVTKAAGGDASDVDELVPFPKRKNPKNFNRLV